MQDAIDRILADLRRMPRPCKPAAELTEIERLGLCIAAGAPTEFVHDAGRLVCRTTVPCGVADDGQGGYVVGVSTRRAAISVPRKG